MNNFYKKYIKYKNKYLVYKKQIGGMTIEDINRYVSRNSITIANVNIYLSDGVIIPERIPPTLINYAKSKAFKKILGFLRFSLIELESSEKDMQKLESSEAGTDEEKKKRLLTQIEEEKAKANTLMDFIQTRIAELPYNEEDAVCALREHQTHLGSPPNFGEISSIKETRLKINSTYKEVQAIKESMMEKSVEVEKQQAIWNAEGYFQKILEHEALVEFIVRWQ